ncbi:MAG: thiamine diphosphokinase, partial [Bacteroidota bacterium]|nr:thiamine diphosphokinase [Bacteroidota bacterium]MDX5430294.1 thiamine diphosphokinase [Bacteroidota bacterium]MDX5469055.1 thiamine diphosphokinase [Bacteroidota bacterium]
HTLNNVMSLFKFQDRIELVMIDDHSRMFTLTKFYKKRYAVGSNISLIPFGLVKGISTKGLEYELNGEDLESGMRSGSSNRVLGDGWVEIQFQEGRLMMMECWD